MHDLPDEFIDEEADNYQDESVTSADETDEENTDESYQDTSEEEARREKDRFNGIVGNVLQKVKDNPSKLLEIDTTKEVKEAVMAKNPKLFDGFDSYDDFERETYIKAQKKQGLSESEARLLAQDRELRIAEARARDSELTNNAIQEAFEGKKLSANDFDKVYRDVLSIRKENSTLSVEDVALLAKARHEKRAMPSKTRALGVKQGQAVAKAVSSTPDRVTLDNIDDLSVEDLERIRKKNLS